MGGGRYVMPFCHRAQQLQQHLASHNIRESSNTVMWRSRSSSSMQQQSRAWTARCKHQAHPCSPATTAADLQCMMSGTVTVITRSHSQWLQEATLLLFFRLSLLCLCAIGHFGVLTILTENNLKRFKAHLQWCPHKTLKRRFYVVKRAYEPRTF